MATIVAKSTGGNWSVGTTWVGNVSPTSADDAVLDATSGNVQSGGTCVCKSLNFTGYTGVFTSNVVVAISGNLTLGGTITGTTGTFTINANSTLTSNGITVPCNLTFTGVNTYTLADNWTVTKLVSINGLAGTGVINGNNLYCNGGFALTGGNVNTNILTGTTTIRLTGTGVWNGGASCNLNLVIDAGSGTITCGTGTTTKLLGFGGGGTLTYTSGTVITTGSVITINGNYTFNTAGITWYDLQFQNPATITINSLLNSTNNGAFNANTVFTGSAGWTIGNLTSQSSANKTFTLAHGVTYTITSIALTGSSASPYVFTSDLAGNQAILTLNQGGTMDILYVNATDIDSSSGRTFFLQRGTLSNATNWRNFTSPNTVAYSFIV